MGEIGPVTVFSFSQAKRHKNKFGAILSVKDVHQRKNQILHPRNCDHVYLTFDDIDRPMLDLRLPQDSDVLKALEFGRNNADRPVMIHCNAGVSRSTACALAILADRHGPGAESDSVRELLEIRDVALPNLAVVAIADRLLERGGSLLAAIREVPGIDRKYALRRYYTEIFEHSALRLPYNPDEMPDLEEFLSSLLAG